MHARPIDAPGDDLIVSRLWQLFGSAANQPRDIAVEMFRMLQGNQGLLMIERAGYEDIELEAEAGSELRVYGELVAVLG